MIRRVASKNVRATWYDRTPLEVLDWHEHHDLSFCFVIKGDYEESTRRQTVTCRPGDVVIKTADLRHLNRFGERGAICLLLELSPQFLEDSIGLTGSPLNGAVQSPQLARIGLDLREELQIADRLSPLMLESIALRTLGTVVRARRGRSKHRARVDEMRQLLDAGNPVDSLTQDYLTAEEKKNARRLFNEIEGCSIKTYALRRRAFRAFDELLNTDQSLSEIALRAGFYDQAHFTKVFAGLFGVTPGRLRSRTEHG